jgi:hypothetical protein
MWVEATAHYSGQGNELSSAVLTPVPKSSFWRVRIAWPNSTPRYFGKFNSKTEAQRWIAEHRSLTRPRQGRYKPASLTTDENSELS